MPKSVKVQDLLKLALLILSTSIFSYSSDDMRWRYGQLVNMTQLLSEFILTCGTSEGLCHPPKHPFNINVMVRPSCAHLYKWYIKSFGVPTLRKSKSINCDDNCGLTSTCAPDAEHAFENVSCVPTKVFPIDVDAINVFSYRMISGCRHRSTRTSSRERLCKSSTQISSSNYFHDIFRPVMSTATNLTYRNRYCAACNDEMDYVSYDLKIDCEESVDMELLNSAENLWSMFHLFNCSAAYVPPVLLQDQALSCSFGSSEDRISHCNETGLWMDYNPDIEWACEQFNSIPYKNYNNIFCFICNPSLLSSTTTELVDSCNITGKETSINREAVQGCDSLPAVSRTFPFKNKYCEICNGIYNETDRPNKQYELFTAQLSEVVAGHVGSKNMSSAHFTNIRFNVSDHSIDTGVPQNKSRHETHAEVILEKLGMFCGYENFCKTPFSYHHVWVMFQMCFFPCSYGSNCCETLSLGLSSDKLMPANFTFNAGEIQNISGEFLNTLDSLAKNFSNTKKYVPVIGQCNSGNKNNEFTDKCENSTISDVLSYIPVHSDTNRAEYKSVYCARCNNDYGSLSSNGFSFHCDKPLEATRALDFALIHEIVKDNNCQVKVKTPPHICTDNPLCVKTCNASGSGFNYSRTLLNMCELNHVTISMFPPVEYNWTWYKNVFCVMCNIGQNLSIDDDELIEECNVTGQWDNTFEPYMNELCINSAPYQGWYPFKSIFCALCNLPIASVNEYFRDIDETETIKPVCQGDGCPCEYGCEAVFASSFRAMFARHSSEESSMLSLSTSMCIAEVGADSPTACGTLSEDTTNLYYELAFGVRIVHASIKPTLYSIMDMFSQHIADLIINHQDLYFDIIEVIHSHIESIKDCNTTFAMNINETRNTPEFNTNTIYVKDQEGKANTNPDQFDFVVRTSLHVDETENKTKLQNALLFFRNTTYNVSHEDGFVFLQSFPYDNYSDCPDQVQDQALCSIDVSSNGDKYTDNAQTVEVNILLSCPLSHIENYTQGLMEEICSLRIPFEHVTKPGILTLCTRYLSELNIRHKDTTIEPFQLANGIFSFICTVCSLVCLGFTFLTYMLFKSIRTIPGVNNMNLVFNLFWAQALTQFGVLQVFNPSVCTVLSILTHYFWLGSFCAMNICSFHMFKVFTSPLYTAMGRSKAIIIKYCIFIYVTPAVVISIYVLIKWLIDGSNNLGYGGDVCFLSETISVVIMFITPASLIILLNAFFSGLAYSHIRSSPRVQSTKAKRNDFKIYVKLLTVTGIAWPMIFIDILLPLSAFSFVSTFANAFQGVFIFAAFICNRKVAGMYRKSCCNRGLFISKHCTHQSTNLKTISKEHNGIDTNHHSSSYT